MLFLVDFPLVYPLMSSTPQPLFKTAQILLNHPSASAEILAGNKCTKSRQILIKTTNSTLCTTKKESYYHAAIQPSALQRLPVACVFSTIFYQISINISIQLWAQIIQISNNTRPTVPKRCTMALFLAAMALDLALLPLEGSSSRLTPILMKCRHRRFVIIPPLSSTLQVSSSKRLFSRNFWLFLFLFGCKYWRTKCSLYAWLNLCSMFWNFLVFFVIIVAPIFMDLIITLVLLIVINTWYGIRYIRINLNKIP